MTLKPLIRWLSQCHIPPALSAAVVLLLLVAGVTIGFIRIGHPALTWLSEAPQHMTELKQKGQKLFPRVVRFSQAAAAVNNLGATEEEQKRAPAVLLAYCAGDSKVGGLSRLRLRRMSLQWLKADGP
jgi:predicted PurR-regulated permease PerM